MSWPRECRATIAQRALRRFALVSILALTGCSKGSTPEQLTARRIEVMQELGTVLAEVTDKDSAAAEEQRVSRIIDDMNTLRRHFTWLTDGEKRALQQAAGERTPELEAALATMKRELARIRANTDLQPVLGPLLEKL